MINARWSGAFFEALAGAGVREVCLSPGSRSTPLVLAAAARSELRLYAHVDERSSGFFALGLARATGRPVAVITTSGTAAANLLPAAVEASWSEVPLLLLTADRPPELRGADANQAIDQIHLFGRYVRDFQEVGPPSTSERALRHVSAMAARAVARAVGHPAGPVHLNFPFAKPLEPQLPGAGAEETTRAAGAVEGASHDARAARAVEDASHETAAPPGTVHIARRPAPGGEAAGAELASALASARRALLVAGPAGDQARLGPAARALAAASGRPLLADPLSGARWGEGAMGRALGAYDLLLRDPRVRSRLAPDLVVRLGASPTSAALLAYLEENAGVPQLVVDSGARWKDHLSLATSYFQADPAEACTAAAARLGPAGDPFWAGLWRRLEEVAREVVVREVAGPAFFEGAVLATVADTVPDGSALFVSNSMPVRDLDAFVGPREAPLRVFANRGASGIDGVVSTAMGVAEGFRRPDGGGSTAAAWPGLVAVVGDLAFYHDMNGLLAARTHGIELVLVLVNNDGGGIFHMLPVRRFEPAFTPYFATPHGLDFRHAAALYGIPHTRVDGVAELGYAVSEALAAGGTRILEVRSDREANRQRHEEIARAVAEAALDVLDSKGAERDAAPDPHDSGAGRWE